MPVFTTFFLNDCMYTPYDLFCTILCPSCTEIFGLSEKTELELELDTCHYKTRRC